ncbi:MAG: hypothetical protein H6611_03705 [Ignavibacteriales bacterium]|nr:hypothetical protein [Ignavibacteriales bacterium]
MSSTVNTSYTTAEAVYPLTIGCKITNDNKIFCFPAISLGNWLIEYQEKMDLGKKLRKNWTGTTTWINF